MADLIDLQNVRTRHVIRLLNHLAHHEVNYAKLVRGGDERFRDSVQQMREHQRTVMTELLRRRNEGDTEAERVVTTHVLFR